MQLGRLRQENEDSQVLFLLFICFFLKKEKKEEIKKESSSALAGFRYSTAFFKMDLMLLKSLEASFVAHPVILADFHRI